MQKSPYHQSEPHLKTLFNLIPNVNNITKLSIEPFFVTLLQTIPTPKNLQPNVDQRISQRKVTVLTKNTEIYDFHISYIIRCKMKRLSNSKTKIFFGIV